MNEYLLMKRGLYYRPDAHGYTDSVFEAGLYSRADALERCEKSDGVTMKRITDLLPEIDGERTQMRARLDELDQLERFALGLKVNGQRVKESNHGN